MIRIFYAHPKGTDRADLLADCEVLAERALAKLGRPAEVVPGLLDFEANFSACGRRWEAWIARWATGADVAGRPHYAWIVVPGTRCGKATAQGVGMALLAGKPVISWDRAAGSFRPVLAVDCADPEDYAAGWVLRCG